MVCGIYKIHRKDKPKQCYIGSSVDIDKRWYDHNWHLFKNKHHCSRLQRVFNKYGKGILEFSIVCECATEDLLEKEQLHVDQHILENGRDNLLNTCKSIRRAMDDPDVRNLINDGIRRKWATDKEFADRKRAFIGGFTKDPEINKRRLDARAKNLKKVRCVELDMVFSSATEASKYMLSLGKKIDLRQISACCNKARKTAGGYNWGFLDDANQSTNKPHQKVRVVMIETGLEFESIADAARYITNKRGKLARGYPISACCLGNLKSAYGYTWRTSPNVA